MKKGAKPRKIEEEMEVVVVNKRQLEESTEEEEEIKEKREERKKARRAPQKGSTSVETTAAPKSSPQKKSPPTDKVPSKKDSPPKNNPAHKDTPQPQPTPDPVPEPAPCVDMPPPKTQSLPSSQPNPIAEKKSPQIRGRSATREGREEKKERHGRNGSWPPGLKVAIDKDQNPYICKVDYPLAEVKYTKMQARGLANLKKLREVGGQNVEKPQYFPNAKMITSFVRTGDIACHPIWSKIASANYAIPGTRLVFDDQESYEKVNRVCVGRMAVGMHPSFYRFLKLTFPSMVGGILREKKISTELASGNLGHTFHMLTQEDFGPVAGSV